MLGKGGTSPTSVPPGISGGGLGSATGALRSKALFQAALGAIRFRKALVDGPLLMASEQVPLVMGALVSLFSVEGDGYMLSEGFVNSNCLISTHEREKSTGSRIPPNFEDCVFRIVPKHKYDARNELNDALTRFNRDRSSISSASTGSGDGMLSQSQTTTIPLPSFISPFIHFRFFRFP